MKLLFTEGVGAVQTTTNAQDEKIKIFASESDMLDNIDTLQENEIVATNDATEADLIGNMLTEIAALKEQLNEMTPRVTDFGDIETIEVSATSETVYDFTADEDCFVAMSQQWSGKAEAGRQCYILDDQQRILAYNGYSGYGSAVITTCFCGYVFVPKGTSIKYMFKGNNNGISSPKLYIRKR